MGSRGFAAAQPMFSDKQTSKSPKSREDRYLILGNQKLPTVVNMKGILQTKQNFCNLQHLMFTDTKDTNIYLLKHQKRTIFFNRNKQHNYIEKNNLPLA